jgi:hypothetical protein
MRSTDGLSTVRLPPPGSGSRVGLADRRRARLEEIAGCVQIAGSRCRTDHLLSLALNGNCNQGAR